MSVTSPPTRKRRVGSTSTQRLRKVHCVECGYLVYMSRRCIGMGLPGCPNVECACHGLALTCADIADAINAGIVSLDDLPRVERTRVCKANGWEDEIIRTSPAQMPGARSSAKQCVEPQCSTFVKRGERYCAAHEHREMPF